MKSKRIITILTLASAAMGSAAAQQGVSALKGHDSQAPVSWESDSMEVQERAQRVFFSGHVVAKQQNLTIRAPQATVTYVSDGGLKLTGIRASGGVVVTSPTETAKGDFAVYNFDDRLISMIGNVELRREGSVLRGGRLVISLDSGVAKLDSGPGGRVGGTFLVKK